MKDVLRRGHVFLNCSLTEAFCIAIVEAAACGLLAVSTNVGGIPEVFPHGVALLAEPRADALIEAIEQALKLLPTVYACTPSPSLSFHNESVYMRTFVSFMCLYSLAPP